MQQLRVQAWLLASAFLVVSRGVCFAQAQFPAIPVETPEEYAERMKHPLTFPTDRISIVPFAPQVPVATPLEITFTLAPGRILGKIWVLQTGPYGVSVEQGSGPAKIVQENGLTKTVEIIPADLGAVTLQISALYSDNGFAKSAIQLNVAPTLKGLQSFNLRPGAVALTVRSDGNWSPAWIRPTLSYDTLKYPIYASDSQQVRLNVEQPVDDPVIRVDKTGLVHALRPGKAVVVGDIGGITSRVPITVYAKTDGP